MSLAQPRLELLELGQQFDLSVYRDRKVESTRVAPLRLPVPARGSHRQLVLGCHLHFQELVLASLKLQHRWVSAVRICDRLQDQNCTVAEYVLHHEQKEFARELNPLVSLFNLGISGHSAQRCVERLRGHGPIGSSPLPLDQLPLEDFSLRTAGGSGGRQSQGLRGSVSPRCCRNSC